MQDPTPLSSPLVPRAIPFGVLVVLRLPVVAISLLTSAYGVLNCSPFAFEMFIRPQLFPWLGSFVAWHHLWHAGAYALTVVTLLPELTSARTPSGRRWLAQWLAIFYVAAGGAAALVLIAQPFLPTLWNDSRALPTALAALLPLVCLAGIDYASAPADRSSAEDDEESTLLGPRRLLAATSATAGCLWFAHFLRALVYEDRSGGVAVWLLTGVRTLSLAAALFAVVYAGLALIAAVAARARSKRLCEFNLTALAVAALLCEFLRRAVLPTISVAAGPAAILASAFGAAIACTWAGLALRRPVRGTGRNWLGTELLIAPAVRPAVAIGALAMLFVLSFTALSGIERIDWSFGARRSILIVEAIASFGLLLRATRGCRAGEWSLRTVVVPPLATLAVFLAIPHAATVAARWSGDRNFEPSIAFYRHAGGEAGFKVLAETLVARPSLDPDYQRFLLAHADFSGQTSITVPDVDFVAPVAAASGVRRARPDIFVFVVDSLRRDYLSPYNARVTFTPNIDRFAAESFAFQNAFTRHGGTELAMPSIWAGVPTVRKVRSQGFERINAIEKLLHRDGYRVAINDFTVAEHLLPATPKTTIDEGVPSVDTDLCSNVRGLEQYLDASAGDERPVFGYFAPMNVHILNTRRRSQSSLDGDYPGFYSPYASRLKRLDACFGAFVSHLKARGRYADSIIVLTSDHGDSLGENGYWGHAMWLFPEDVRIPLIVRVPQTLTTALTTDLTRLTFSTDIAPTLYTLLGHRIRSPGPLFGESLFVSADCELSDRRRQSYLLTSSYGATYGLLRRNGRQLYVSDLVEWSESAYDLSIEGGGKPVTADADLRRINQRLIRHHVDDVAALYRFSK